MKYSVSSRNTNPWSNTKPIGILRLYSQIMAKNSPQNNSRNSVESLGLRGSWALHIILSRMGLQNEITRPKWKWRKKCYITRIFLCTFGQRKQEQMCMYRTVLVIEYLTKRPSKMHFQEWNLKSAISGYLAAPYTYTSQRRKGPSLILRGRREYL